MKCLVCQWDGEPAEWTCPMCGEASWSESEPAVEKPKKVSKKSEPSPKATS